MHVRLNPERSGTTRLYLSQNVCRFYSWTTLPPSPSLLACPLAPGYLLLARRWCPMSPTPKHARSSEDAPFGPTSSNGVFAGRVVGRILLPRRRSCLVGAWRDADFAIIAITTKKPRQSAVPRTKLVKFVGVAGAGSGAVPERPSPFLLYRRGVRARAPREFGGAARTHKGSTRPDFITIIRCGWFCTVGPPRKHSPCC